MMDEATRQAFALLNSTVARLTDESLGHKLFINALMKSHPDPAGLERAIEAELELALAHMLPSPLSETSVDFLRQQAKRGVSIAQARSRELGAPRANPSPAQGA